MSEKEQQEIRQLSEKTDHDLLVELVCQQQKNARLRMISTCIQGGILVLLLIAFVMIVPRTTSTFKQIETGMTKLKDFIVRAEEELDNLDELSEQAKESLKGIDSLASDADSSLEGIDEMVSNINQLVVDNSEALDETISKMNEIEFDKLNKAITDLANVVAPLAALFGGG